MTRRFCVLTTGRAGSTALMSAIAADPRVAVPSRRVTGWAEELLNWTYAKDHASAYGAATGRTIGHQGQLVDAFFDAHRDAAFAGFKLLPKQHRALDDFLTRSDVTFITLERADRAATVASMVAAEIAWQWNRPPGSPPPRWRFDDSTRERVRHHALELADALAALRRAPAPIRLVYEDLCLAGCTAGGLDAFFGREVRLAGRQAPRRADEYVGEWRDMEAFVDRTLRSAAGGAWTT